MSAARRLRRTPVPLGAALLALALVGASGCSPEWAGRRVTAPAPVAPVADSPAHAVQALQWAYDHRSMDVYRTLFSDDFVFTFDSLDPAGESYRGPLWGIDLELRSADHLFVTGTASEEPANAVSLAFEHAPTVTDDPRPGKAAKWHQQVSVPVLLTVQRTSSGLQVKGGAKFFLVRGDSARVVGRTVAADSTRWYFEGWQDVTIVVAPAGRAGPASPQPGSQTTWGRVKALYL